MTTKEELQKQTLLTTIALLSSLYHNKENNLSEISRQSCLMAVSTIGSLFDISKKEIEQFTSEIEKKIKDPAEIDNIINFLKSL